MVFVLVSVTSASKLLQQIKEKSVCMNICCMMVRKCERTYEVLSPMIMQQYNSILFMKSYLPRTALNTGDA